MNRYTRAAAAIAAVLLLGGAALLFARDAHADFGPGGGQSCITTQNGKWVYVTIPLGATCTGENDSGIVLARSDIPAEQARPAVVGEWRGGPAYRFFYQEDNLPNVGPTTATTRSPANQDIRVNDGVRVPPRIGTFTPSRLADGVPFTVVYKANEDHRTVEEDGEYYREWRDNGGNWRRSGSYGMGEEAKRQASWNTFQRSVDGEIYDPSWNNRLHGPNPNPFPSGEPPAYIEPDPFVAATGLTVAKSGQAVSACHSPEEESATATYCPDAPTVTATPGPHAGQITLEWTPASSGAEVHWWNVSSRLSGTTSWTERPPLPAASRSYTFTTGLVAGTAYDVQIRGVHYYYPQPNTLRRYYGHPSRVTNIVAAADPPPATLIKNAGQTDGSQIAFNEDFAFAFTTGSESGGYMLTSVQIEFGFGARTQTTAAQFFVTIREGSGTNVGSTDVGGLTSSVLGLGFNTFSSEDGIALDADTDYFVVIDVSSLGNKQPWFRSTASNNEDSGGADGWSIGNRIVRRDATTANAPWSLASTTSTVKMTIKGYAR